MQTSDHDPSPLDRLSSGMFLLAIVLIAGCDPKDSREPAAGLDIRGAPIVQAAKTPTSNAAPSIPPASVPNTMTSPGLSPASASPGFQTAGFDRLSSYAFEMSDDVLGPVTNEFTAAAVLLKTDAQIPRAVHALNNQRVAIRGFMLPLKVEGGVVKELLIMKDQSMCCYGTTPKINEWVSVKMKDKGVKPMMDQPVTLFGTLHVGEMRENGYLVGIYQLDGERMEAPED